MNIEEVLSTTHRISPRERVPFHCACCGECCRHVRQSVPLESPDVFRLTRLLREKDKGIICMATLLRGIPNLPYWTNVGISCSC